MSLPAMSICPQEKTALPGGSTLTIIMVPKKYMRRAEECTEEGIKQWNIFLYLFITYLF